MSYAVEKRERETKSRFSRPQNDDWHFTLLLDMEPLYLMQSGNCDDNALFWLLEIWNIQKKSKHKIASGRYGVGIDGQLKCTGKRAKGSWNTKREKSVSQRCNGKKIGLAALHEFNYFEGIFKQMTLYIVSCIFNVFSSHSTLTWSELIQIFN